MSVKGKRPPLLRSTIELHVNWSKEGLVKAASERYKHKHEQGEGQDKHREDEAREGVQAFAAEALEPKVPQQEDGRGVVTYDDTFL